jgi:hypothetical protein
MFTSDVAEAVGKKGLCGVYSPRLISAKGHEPFSISYGEMMNPIP